MRGKQPQYAQLVERVLVEEQSQKPEGIDACIYVDEYVPGNILAPDNRRKSYCIYFTFLTLARYRSIQIWWPVAVLRHSQIDLLPGGAPEFLTRTIRMLKPAMTGLVCAWRCAHRYKNHLRHCGRSSAENHYWGQRCKWASTLFALRRLFQRQGEHGDANGYEVHSMRWFAMFQPHLGPRHHRDSKTFEVYPGNADTKCFGRSAKIVRLDLQWI